MRRSSRVIGLALALLAGAGIGAGGLWLVVRGNVELRYHLLERATGNQPLAQIEAFVQAVTRGDRSTALELWEVGNTTTQSALVRRRDEVITDLAGAGISPDYRVLGLEWWTTCCEPSVTCDSRSAGGARLAVQFLDSAGQPLGYTFDVFTREQPYWGSALGYPSREWVIRDAYPRGQEPLYWRLVYEPQVRYIQP